MFCESGCYEMDVAGCESALVPTALGAFVDYRVRLKRAGSTVFFDRDITTDADGKLLLENYPAGLFNRGEMLQMTVFTKKCNSKQVMMQFDGSAYSCVMLRFVKIKK